MEFLQEITVHVPPARVWDFLWDIERLAACIPGCQSVKAVQPGQRYEAVVAERIGPFKVQFPLQVEVLEAKEPQSIRVRAAGKDSSLGSSLKVLLAIALSDAAQGGTHLKVRADVAMLGKLAVLGGAVFQRKVDEVTAAFAASLRQALEDVA